VGAGVTCWSIQLGWLPDGTGEVLAFIPQGAQTAQFWADAAPGANQEDGSVRMARGAFRFSRQEFTHVEIAVEMNAIDKADGVIRVRRGVGQREVCCVCVQRRGGGWRGVWGGGRLSGRFGSSMPNKGCLVIPLATQPSPLLTTAPHACAGRLPCRRCL
jgi:hypothetical protein